jgi:hypothetical protein
VREKDRKQKAAKLSCGSAALFAEEQCFSVVRATKNGGFAALFCSQRKGGGIAADNSG